MFTSLRGKLVLIFIVVTLGAVVASTGYTIHLQTQFALNRAAERSTEDLRQISSEIQTILQWVIKEIFVLRDLPQLHRFLESREQASRADALTLTESAFLVLAGHHKIYNQVRFLDETGQEVIRVNFDGTTPKLVPVGKLQHKGHRYYFKEAITLENGQIYISPMDLNIENSVIERPFVPTIRYATLVTDSHGKTRGMIVLNVLGTNLLQVLERQQIQARQSGRRYNLLNTEGFFLFHPDQTKTFGFMLGSGERLERYEPTLMERLSNTDRKGGVVVKNSEASGRATVFAFQQIPMWKGPLDHFRFSLASSNSQAAYNLNIEPNQAKWILLSAVDKKDLLVDFEEYTKPFFFFTIFLLAGCVLVATLVGLLVSRPVVSLAAAARRIQDGDLSARAAIYSRDEMGKFGRLFNNMAEKLEQSVNRLKESEAKYRELFENSRDCFFVADNTDQVIDINRACKALLGIPSKAGVPAGLSIPWHHEHAHAPAAFHKAISTAGYVKDYEVHVTRSDGSPLVCLMTATARRSADGTLMGCEGTLRDITERRKRIQARRKFHKRLQEEIVMAEERERRSMAQVLHEELAQNLALLHMKAQVMEALLPGPEADVKSVLQDSQILLTRMIRQIRTMTFDLYPAILDEQGLLPTLKWYAQSFTERTGIVATVFEVSKSPSLTKPQKVYLFRAYKELLHNVWKHAEASEAVVTVAGKEESLRIVVNDDGKGFDTNSAFESSQQIKGIGLFSIREWITNMDGRFSVESHEGKGTRVLMEIPLPRNAGGNQ